MLGGTHMTIHLLCSLSDCEAGIPDLQYVNGIAVGILACYNKICRHAWQAFEAELSFAASAHCHFGLSTHGMLKQTWS